MQLKSDREILEIFDIIQNQIKSRYEPYTKPEKFYRKNDKKCTTAMYIELSSYESYYPYLSEEEFKRALNFKQKRKRKRQKANEISKQIIDRAYLLKDLDLNCNLIFGTCTFNNKALKRKEETNTKKVNKFIKEHCICAMANIDYGNENERIHHHFLGVTTDNLIDTGHKSKKGYELYNFENNNYNIGFCDMLVIPKEIWETKDIKKISNYLVKFKFHAIKNTTKNRRLRYLTN